MDHWAMIYLWSSGAPKTSAVAPWARGEDEEDGGFGGIGGFAASGHLGDLDDFWIDKS